MSTKTPDSSRPAPKKGGAGSGSRQGVSARKPAAGAASKQRPSGARPSQGQRPQGSRPQTQRPPSSRPTAGNGRPASAGQRPLVRPAPRSKVRRAHLTVAKIDLWSIAKLTFLLSVAVGIATVVATVILWLVFEVTGFFNTVNQVLSMLSSAGNAVDVTDYLSMGQVAIYATVLSVINVILLTLLTIIAGFLYNVAAKLVGGIGVTLTDD